jgi:hypothetical protein
MSVYNEAVQKAGLLATGIGSSFWAKGLTLSPWAQRDSKTKISNKKAQFPWEVRFLVGVDFTPLSAVRR